MIIRTDDNSDNNEFLCEIKTQRIRKVQVEN